jgi:hypothetical protein
VAVAGHRDSFFRPLRNVKVGDDIELDTPEEHLHYRVSWFHVVNSRDVSVIGPTKDAALTLVTCYPFWFIGEAPDRFVVRGTRVGDPVNGDPVDRARIAKVLDIAAANEDRPTPSPRALAQSGKSRAATDEALVKDAIDRFRLAYNAGLARHEAAGRDELMRFSSCEVSVSGTKANATCRVVDRSPSGSPSAWVFRVDRIAGQWTVTTVGMD